MASGKPLSDTRTYPVGVEVEREERTVNQPLPTQPKDAAFDGGVAGSLTAVGAFVVLRRIVSIVT